MTAPAPMSPAQALAALERWLVPVDERALTVRLYRHAFKRVLDLLVALAACVLLLPLALVVAGLVALGLGRPVLFRQVRLARAAQPFTMLKFRTMRPDRRAAGAAGMPPGLERRHPVPRNDDPRLTALGRALSACGLDELPQLLHVLSGRMSLVGPRPDYLHRSAVYVGRERQRFEVPPGLTGPWQVLAGSATDLHAYVALDLLYVRRQSFGNDLRLLLRTPWATCRRAWAATCLR